MSELLSRLMEFQAQKDIVILEDYSIGFCLKFLDIQRNVFQKDSRLPIVDRVRRCDWLPQQRQVQGIPRLAKIPREASSFRNAKEAYTSIIQTEETS